MRLRLRGEEEDVDLLTVRETADLLRVSQLTVRRYIAAGRLPAVRFGRNIRIDREEIGRLLTTSGRAAAGAQLSIPVGTPTSDDDAFWEIVGNGDAPDAADISEHEYSGRGHTPEQRAEPILHSSEEENPSLASWEPTSDDDPLWEIVGIASIEGPTDLARNKHHYLAQAYEDKHR